MFLHFVTAEFCYLKPLESCHASLSTVFLLPLICTQLDIVTRGFFSAKEPAHRSSWLASSTYVRSSIVEGLHGHHHKCTATAPSSTVPSGTEENITVGDPIDATDTGVIYTMSVGVGEPAVEYTLAIDTGSGHTWVGANLEKPYKPSECSHDTGHAIVS
ncbi:hypothetical protein EDB19DRAFT_209303 [Suillus lakei]|nr:hypothetical protein EDB19DRAFT_209303 [Suillus lakei]